METVLGVMELCVILCIEGMLMNMRMLVRGEQRLRQLNGIDTMKLKVPSYDGTGSIDNYFDWED